MKTRRIESVESVECQGVDLTPFMTHGFDTTPQGSRGRWTLWLQRFPISEEAIETLEGVISQFGDQPLPVKIDGRDRFVSVQIRANKPDEFVVQLDLC